ncbi:aldo/keto reductase [Tenacibaculum agarivorans]|uniref:aldo/keto reductase n=1 Tax=Tenacibaculum agarivorans TaxID=1908389 RepID=UPI00094B7C19|nr:aldo/keto reductase [Tenacibaculum agarivorans]
MKTKLSDIIIGCMNWGVWGKNYSTQEMTDLIHFCIEEGNTTFDHADIYGGYTTEAEFGEAFVKSGVEREQIQLISKCGIQYITETRTKNRVKHYNYSKEYIIWSVEESLKNLKTDYLDVLLLHRPSPLMEPDEIAEAILQLQAEGKILDFGVSNFNASQMELLADKITLNYNQLEFSLIQNSAIDHGTLDYLLKNDMKVMSWSPLGGFFNLEGEQAERVREVLQILSKKYDATHDQLLLAWILKHPSNVIPVIGTSNKNRIQTSNLARKIDLDLQDWFILYEASRGHKVA